MTTTRSPRLAKRKADDLFRKIIHARAACERCGRTTLPVEAAHIIRRRYSWTRTQEDNAWALCRECHEAVDRFPDQLVELVGITIGMERYRELVLLSQRREKFDWFAEAARLAAVWKQMKAAA